MDFNEEKMKFSKNYWFINIINTSNLIGDNFVIRGNEGTSTLGKKTNVTLPIEVEAKFYNALTKIWWF